MKKFISLICTALLMVLILTGCTSKKVKLNLDDMQGPDTKISLDGKEYSKNNDEFFKLLENVENYKEDSVNETPVNIDKYHTFVIKNDDKEKHLHLYTKKKIGRKYYIEIPYEGIWEIDQSLYEKLID